MKDNIRYKGESDEMNRKKMGSSVHGRKKMKKHSFHGNREGNGFGGCL